MANGFRVTEITRSDAFATLSERWDQAVSASAAPNVFVTSEWLRAWWTHFGGGQDLWLLLVERPSGEPVGAAPLMIVPHQAAGVALRALEFVGADVPACADHLEVACAPGLEHEVAEAVGLHLVRKGHRWDTARWAAVPQGSVSMGRLADFLHAHRLRSEWIPLFLCPYLALDQPWEVYDRHLQRKFRDLKKYLAAVERRSGRFLLVRTETELDRILPDLRRLNLLRVRSKGDVPGLGRDELFAFVSEICVRFLRRGWLRLYAIEVEGQVIATNLNFAYADKVYGYMSGFDPAWTRHGIGTVLMRHVIRSSMEEGFREYDFLRGGEDYKYRWTSRQRAAMTLRVVNHRFRYWAFTGGRLTDRGWSILRQRLARRNGPFVWDSQARAEPEREAVKAER